MTETVSRGSTSSSMSDDVPVVRWVSSVRKVVDTLRGVKVGGITIKSEEVLGVVDNQEM